MISFARFLHSSKRGVPVNISELSSILMSSILFIAWLQVLTEPPTGSSAQVSLSSCSIHAQILRHPSSKVVPSIALTGSSLVSMEVVRGMVPPNTSNTL